MDQVVCSFSSTVFLVEALLSQQASAAHKQYHLKHQTEATLPYMMAILTITVPSIFLFQSHHEIIVKQAAFGAVKSAT